MQEGKKSHANQMLRRHPKHLKMTYHLRKHKSASTKIEREIGENRVSGLKSIGKERIARSAVKRGARSMLFDVLIWVVTRIKEDLSRKKFQMQIADLLGLAVKKSDDCEDEEDDENDQREDFVLAGKMFH
ncbi:hypothetical protein IFM89_028415 [Coptis chinensis]|uniref:Uncharacterized protein n=1 Tax=Coptis chinensis TaxID=261450 RepID=A0A835IT65_9MAGN|nr:hypothetical protein IFM89_028415 [Coptis chinensis]